MSDEIFDYAEKMAELINSDGTVDPKFNNLLIDYTYRFDADCEERSILKELAAQIRGVDWRENYE